MWNQLPVLILTQIFGHLGREDRANVAQICQSWDRALSSPVLWRSVTILIDRDLRGDSPLEGDLAVRNTYEPKDTSEYFSLVPTLNYFQHSAKRTFIFPLDPFRARLNEVS